MSSITYLEAIREAQYEALRANPNVCLYGQDISTFGGAFKATKNLGREFPGRVFDARFESAEISRVYRYWWPINDGRGVELTLSNA